MTTTTLLNNLSKHSCTNLILIAKQILTGKRIIKIPKTKKAISIKIFKRKGNERGYFIENKIGIYRGSILSFEGKKGIKNGILQTLVHELRHAQQRDVLGYKEFDNITAKSPTLTNALEYDAMAAEIINGVYKEDKIKPIRMSWNKDVRKMVLGMNTEAKIISKQVKAIKLAAGRNRT